MSAPTPAEAFVPADAAAARARAKVFHRGSSLTNDRERVGRMRADALAAATRDVDRLAASLHALCAAPEADVDLRVELYRRAANRADISLDVLDDALDNPAGTPVPAPHARHP